VRPQPLNDKQGNLPGRLVSPNILVSSLSAKRRNLNEFDKSPEALERKHKTMAHDHRVSYNVRLSIDQAYHIIDTD